MRKAMKEKQIGNQAKQQAQAEIIKRKRTVDLSVDLEAMASPEIKDYAEHMLQNKRVYKANTFIHKAKSKISIELIQYLATQMESLTNDNDDKDLEDKLIQAFKQAELKNTLERGSFYSMRTSHTKVSDKSRQGFNGKTDKNSPVSGGGRNNPNTNSQPAEQKGGRSKGVSRKGDRRKHKQQDENTQPKRETIDENANESESFRTALVGKSEELAKGVSGSRQKKAGGGDEELLLKNTGSGGAVAGGAALGERQLGANTLGGAKIPASKPAFKIRSASPANRQKQNPNSTSMGQMPRNISQFEVVTIRGGGERKPVMTKYCPFKKLRSKPSTVENPMLDQEYPKFF